MSAPEMIGIELSRLFFAISSPGEEPDPEQLMRIERALQRGKVWADVLQHRYVVVLGEAGTGKSTEFRRRAASLLASGGWGFFVDINGLATEGLAASIGIDRQRDVQGWLRSGDEAFFLLDSLDEAKLQRQTLERALRKLRLEVYEGWSRVRLAVSCRASDWQAGADEEALRAVIPDGTAEQVYVVQLGPLETHQVEALARYVGVTDVPSFSRAIVDRHAQVFVERPLDVKWLAGYWKRHGRLAGLTELITDNIREKLKDRADRASSLTPQQREAGVRALAGIATLTQQHSFVVPDDSLVVEGNAGAIDPGEILRDWSPVEVMALLRLPIFDESTYGRVRFHHRSVREFLTARWLLDLLDGGLARTGLEDILFRDDDDGKISPHDLAPVVSWMAIWDSKLREEVIKQDPSLLLAHGDPAQLSAVDRSSALRAYAAEYGNRERLFDTFDHETLERFASPELSATVLELLSDPSLKAELAVTLLRIVEHGAIHACVPLALNLISDQNASDYVRAAAVSAVAAAGTEKQHDELRSLIGLLERWPAEVTAALIRALYPDGLSPKDFLELLRTSVPPPDRVLGGLSMVLDHEVPRAGDADARLALLESIVPFASTTDSDGSRELSPEREWLLPLVGNLLAAVLQDCVRPETLPAGVREAIELVDSCRHMPRNVGLDLKAIDHAVGLHPALRQTLFWRSVTSCRSKNGVIPTRYYELRPFALRSIHLTDTDVNWLTADARTRPDVRERLLAFDALMSISTLGNVGARSAAQLEELAKADPALGKRLAREATRPAFVHPRLVYEQLRLRAREVRDTRICDANREYLSGKVNEIRIGADFRLLWFLFNDADHGSNSWGQVSTEPLREKYGAEIADAARTGWINFWRRHDPSLPHEQGSRSGIPNDVLLGFVGLASEIEAGLDVTTLGEPDMVRAVRYAACELNRFPDWLTDIAAANPKLVETTLHPALTSDYGHPADAPPVHDVLAKLPYANPGVQKACLPSLVDLIESRDPARMDSLTSTLEVISSADSRGCLQPLFHQRCAAANLAPPRFSVWWVTWLEQDAISALDFLEHQVGGAVANTRSALVLEVCSLLEFAAEGRTQRRTSIRSNRDILVRLVPIVYQHVNPSSDVDRVDDCPRLRDRAQQFRSRLVRWLGDLPGRATVQALRQLAEDNRLAAHRDWVLRLSDERRVADAAHETPTATDTLVALYQEHGLGAAQHLGPLSKERMDHVHVGIITVIEEEYRAVLDSFAPASIRRGANADYEIAVVDTPNGACSVAIRRCLLQGNLHAQTVAMEMLDDLSPDFVLVVGIAGGIPTTDFCLGDVIVASRIVDTTLEDTGTSPSSVRYDAFGHPLHTAAERIVTRLQSLEQRAAEAWENAIEGERPTPPGGSYSTKHTEWNRDIQAALENFATRTAPRATVKAIASSDRLVKDPEIIARWRLTMKSVSIVEMESAGIYGCCSRRGVPAITIRAISDIVGLKRDDAWKVYACRAAAAYAHMLVRSGVFCRD
jgi:nucleoside phosphorylase